MDRCQKKKQKVCFKQDNSSDKPHVWRPRDEYREIPVVSYHNNGSTSDKQMEIDSTPEDSSPLSKPNFKNLLLYWSSVVNLYLQV